MSIEKTDAAGTPGFVEGAGQAEQERKRSKAGAFFSAIGKAAGVAAGVMMPGVGPVIGGILGGKSMGLPVNFSGGMLGPEASQFLRFQQQMTSEMRAFELASTILKNRHDASMSAIRNMKG